MKSTYLFSIYILLITSFSNCQQTNSPRLSTIGKLPFEIHEISGISKFPDDPFLYAINDSGNDASIFKLNLKGGIETKIQIPNLNNIDWEDTASDTSNTIYIGDFGNNKYKRKSFTIYKVHQITSINPYVEKIDFVFEDTKNTKKKHINFDIEAMIHYNNHLFLFSKDRSSKFKGMTKLYKIPDIAGNYKAKLVSTFTTCNDDKDCFITGASINQDKTKIALLTYDKIFLLSNFKGDQLFEGSIQKLN